MFQEVRVIRITEFKRNGGVGGNGRIAAKKFLK